jgi:hypothetical protein
MLRTLIILLALAISARAQNVAQLEAEILALQETVAAQSAEIIALQKHATSNQRLRHGLPACERLWNWVSPRACGRNGGVTNRYGIRVLVHQEHEISNRDAGRFGDVIFPHVLSGHPTRPLLSVDHALLDTVFLDVVYLNRNVLRLYASEPLLVQYELDEIRCWSPSAVTTLNPAEVELVVAEDFDGGAWPQLEPT